MLFLHDMLLVLGLESSASIAIFYSNSINSPIGCGTYERYNHLTKNRCMALVFDHLLDIQIVEADLCGALYGIVIFSY